MKQELYEAMQIARNFQQVNNKTKMVSSALAELRSCGNWFLSDDEVNILRQADRILDELRDKSNEWNCAKYLEKHLEELNLVQSTK